MTSQPEIDYAPPPPPVMILQMVTGYWVSMMIYAVTKAGIADLLHEQPQTADELATATDLHPRSLYRILRALVSLGIFAEDETGTFSQTPLSDILRKDVPGSVRAMVLMMMDGEHFGGWQNLEYSLKTGGIALDQKYGKNVWGYYADNPDRAAIFDEAMTSMSSMANDAVVAAYDFSSIQKIVDVGGGHGSLLAGILKANPTLKGVLFDQPSVVSGSGKFLGAIAERCEVVSGNMFETVPSGADAILMKHIIHDWDDERSFSILKNCHQALSENGKLLLVETVVPPGSEPHFAKLLDINMLVLTGGCERTEAEYRTLLSQAGFTLTRIVPTPGAVSIIEGIRN